MRAIIFRRGSCSIGGSSFTGGTLTNPLILAGDPTHPLGAATKQYVDSGLAALNANNLTSGTVPVARLPAFTGDISSSAGTNTLVLSNTGVAAGTYTKVTVDAKGRVTAGTTLAASDIPNLDWSKITTGKPTTLSGYGITDGVNKSGDSMTGPLTLSGNATSPLHAVPLQQLSEVASGNNGVEFIASGDIPGAGLTVGLNANGTVSVISLSEQPGSGSSPAIFNNNHTGLISAVYDSASQKVIIAYRDGTQGRAIVGTVSGNSISFGAPVTFVNIAINYVSAVYVPASTNQKVVIVYQFNSHGHWSTFYTAAKVGIVSGNSITFGPEDIFGGYVNDISMVYDSANQKLVIGYSNNDNMAGGHYSTAGILVGTVPSNYISFDVAMGMDSSNINYLKLTYDYINNKVIMFYHNYIQKRNYVRVITLLPSGFMSFGPEAFLYEGVTDLATNIIYIPINQKVVVLYNYNSSSTTSTTFDRTAAVVGTVSGNSISFGLPVIFNNTHALHMSAVYNSVSNKVVIAYSRDLNDYYGAVITGTVSEDSISFSAPVIFHSGHTYNISAVYDSANNKIVIAYNNNNQNGSAIVFSPGILVSNKNTFIGISQNSATNGATVSVKIKGQVDSNQSGLTPGQLYYVSDNGTLTTNSINNFLAGRAISATKLLITNWTIN